MKLQIALDHTSLEQALPVAIAVAPYVDIIELGTPLIKTAGLYGLRVIRSCFPNHLIVADLKTMDAGEYEATPFFEAGANIVTVLGAADFSTIKGTIKAARPYGKMAQVDLINVSNKIDLFEILADTGAHIVGIHTGIDQQLAGMTPFKDLSELTMYRITHDLNIQISLAGGIKAATLEYIKPPLPDIVVVGGAITSASNPVAAVKEIRNIIDKM
ncbi:MAG: 3-hexulose-6-phosphate synthase [Nitrosopumilaceae archaeon]